MRNKFGNQTNDDILRNCFTGYLASAVQHRRADYFVEQERTGQSMVIWRKFTIQNPLTWRQKL